MEVEGERLLPIVLEELDPVMADVEDTEVPGRLVELAGLLEVPGKLEELTEVLEVPGRLDELTELLEIPCDVVEEETEVPDRLEGLEMLAVVVRADGDELEALKAVFEEETEDP